MCATLLTVNTGCPSSDDAYTSSIPPTERDGYCYSLLHHCFTCPMHNHTHYEISLVISGRITHYVSKQALLLSPGDLFFIRPEDTHALDARSGATLVNIAFSRTHFERFLQYAEDLALPLERLRGALPLTITVNPTQALDAYERFNARRDAVGAPVQLALRELLCELFGMLLCEPANPTDASPEWLNALCREMRRYENFTAPSDTMVRLSGYSREHLSRSMKRYLGVTPSEFLCGLRLDHAAGLLRLTSMPVLDVCMASGFENPAYFHRRFREKFGMTPGRFRSLINGKSQSYTFSSSHGRTDFHADAILSTKSLSKGAIKMEKIRYGIIGLSMGAYHAKGVAAQEESELAAVYDPNPEAVEAVVRDSHPLRVANSWQEITQADDIDVVVVCTPDQLHEEMTISALENGKHVLCEKPMALTREACAHMIAVSEATGRKLMVGQVCRYAPAFAKAKALIDAGEIGELYFVESEYAHDYLKVRGANDWRVDPMRYGLLGGGCHAMDLLSWIAGRPEEVFAYSNHKMLKDWPTDDTTIAVLKYPNDVIGKVFCSISCKRDYTMRSLFYGSKGTIICDNTSPEMTIFDENHTPRKLPIDINNHNVFAEISEMTAAIRENRQPATTGYDGADTVSICLSAVESTKSGLPVKIAYLR